MLTTWHVYIIGAGGCIIVKCWPTSFLVYGFTNTYFSPLIASMKYKPSTVDINKFNQLIMDCVTCCSWWFHIHVHVIISPSDAIRRLAVIGDAIHRVQFNISHFPASVTSAFWFVDSKLRPKLHDPLFWTWRNSCFAVNVEKLRWQQVFFCSFRAYLKLVIVLDDLSHAIYVR